MLGPLVLVVGLLCFTYSTMLGWSQYGDRAITYLFGTKGIRPYQVVFLLFVFWGCIGVATWFGTFPIFPTLLWLSRIV